MRFDDDRLIRYAASYGLQPAFLYLRDEVGLDPASNSGEAFVLACQSGHVELAKMVGTEWAHARDNSAFRMSVDMGQLESVKFLVETCGVDPSLQDNLGCFLATAKRNVPMLLYLLGKGGSLSGKVEAADALATWSRASLEQQDALKDHMAPFLTLQHHQSKSTTPKTTTATPLSDAIVSGKPLPNDTLESKEDASTAFAMCCQLGDFEQAGALLQRVPSLDRRMGLNLAVSHGHQPASNLLPTVWKPSPAAVAAAAANGHLAVLQWLHSRKTPMPSILSALNSGQATIVTFLADHHRVSAEDVMTAVRTGQLALVQALGSTPGKPHLLLAEACRMGYLELAKYFVQQGAVLTNQADACVFGSTHLARAVLPPESLHHCRMPFLRRNVLVGRAPLRPFELVELCKRGCSVLSVLPGWRKSPECAAALGSNGHVELVQRLDESVQPAAFEAAAANGHLSCLHVSKRPPSLRSSMVNAAYAGRTMVMEYLLRTFRDAYQLLDRARVWAQYADRRQVVDLLDRKS